MLRGGCQLGAQCFQPVPIGLTLTRDFHPWLYLVSTFLHQGPVASGGPFRVGGRLTSHSPTQEHNICFSVTDVRPTWEKEINFLPSVFRIRGKQMAGLTNLEMHISILAIYFSDENISPTLGIQRSSSLRWMIWNPDCEITVSWKWSGLPAFPLILVLSQALEKGRK